VRFDYVAYNLAGAPRKGRMEADSRDEALERLRAEGLFIESLTPVRETGRASRRRFSPKLGGGNRLKLITGFAKQLSVLCATGTPLLDGLRALERQSSDDAFRAVLADIVLRVEEGGSLSEAMEAHPRWFDPVCRSLVAAGESGGHMETMLTRLASLLRQQQHVRSSLTGAMIYPVLLIFVAVGVLGLMLLFVLPRFTGLFETLDMSLPPSTQVMLVISDFLRSFWWGLLALAIGGAIGGNFWIRTPQGRRTFDTVAIRVPYFGSIVKRFATARLARLLGVLLESKVSLLDALSLTRESCANAHYRTLLVQTEKSVEQGESVSSAFLSSGLVEPSICEALRNGERSGRVGSVLTSVADYLDQENDVVVRSLTSILEPIILIVLGALVGIVAVSMFLPLFDLTAMTQTGS